MYRNRFLIVLSIIILFVIKSDAFIMALDDPELSHNVLSGLRSIYVQVAVLDATAKEEELTADQLKENIIRQLQEAGIETLYREEYQRLKKSRSYPLALLEVNIEVAGAKGFRDKYYNVIIRIKQLVFLARRPAVRIMAPTWERRLFSYTGSSASVEEKIKEVMEGFIKEFQSENPK
jgi:hypothetical protein